MAATARATWFIMDGAASRWNFRLGGGTNVYTNVTVTGDNYVGDISGGAATPGVWSHVVATYNGSSAALYVNGAQVASTAVDPTQFAVNTNNVFRIGATTIPNRNFDGWIKRWRSIMRRWTAIRSGSPRHWWCQPRSAPRSYRRPAPHYRTPPLESSHRNCGWGWWWRQSGRRYWC